MKKKIGIQLAVATALPLAALFSIQASAPYWPTAAYHLAIEQEKGTVKSITAEKKWLLLPVKNGAKKRKVQLLLDGKPLRTCDIELADAQPDWYAYLDISAWKGEKLELAVDTLPPASQALTLIKQDDKELDGATAYHEPLRAQFHFSPKRGWNNDPNGLVYYNGEYHLFFQHNPYGVLWGNMHWGHAVSKDLVHWKEIGEALYPDSFGTMFSGSGIVDKGNSSGFGTAENPPMVLFYTAEGSWMQGLAYSTDGRTFKKTDHPVIPKITEGNRDPKVIWHEPSKHWVMVFYVAEANEQHTMHFFTSTNLKDWEEASVINGGKGDDRYLFECPEFFEIPIEGTNEKKWILTGANSQYAIGSFDGKTFVPEVERLNGQFGRDFYAAQTFNNEPKGRRIEIGWWRTHTNIGRNSFNQSMSIPMELKLIQTPEGPRLSRTPVAELQSLRGKAHRFEQLKVGAGQTESVPGVEAELMEIHAVLLPAEAKSMQLNIRGLDVSYDVKTEELRIDGVKAHLPLSDGKLDLTIYADRTGLELFANNGLFFMPINKNLDANQRGLSLTANGGDAQCEQLLVYELKSIWD